MRTMIAMDLLEYHNNDGKDDYDGNGGEASNWPLTGKTVTERDDV